jgi:hypothetical protein
MVPKMLSIGILTVDEGQVRRDLKFESGVGYGHLLSYLHIKREKWTNQTLFV